VFKVILEGDIPEVDNLLYMQQRVLQFHQTKETVMTNLPASTPTPTPTSDWMNPDKLHKDYFISKSTQAKLRMKKQIPFSKIGSMVFYSRKEINEWLSDHKVA